jgi:streptomycin 6-kinase
MAWQIGPQMLLHTGQPLPRQMVETVRGWDPHQTTPGWLDQLPTTIADLCTKWTIELDHVVPDTYVTLVALGQSEELGPVVIKSSALADEFLAETTALNLGAGENVARIYDLDLERSAMVIERIVPGTQLRDAALSDDDATRLAAETVATYWRPVPDPVNLHPLRRWMRAWFEWSPRPDLIDPDMIQHAQDLATALLARSTQNCLLHGDFQHHNLLQRSSGEWVIIDPKGLYGDPGFEFAAWMYNPEGVTARVDYLELATRRAAICSDIWGINRQTLLEWAFVGAVLSMCWWNSESGPEDLAIHFALGARQLRQLLHEGN